MDIRGSAPLAKPWRHIVTSGSALKLLPTVGLIAALALAVSRVGWNLSRPNDLFLDSWVLVHVLQILNGEVDMLPRAVLTLQYPLAYLPLAPLAKVFGAFATVKLAYPVIASLAAVPAYLIVRRSPAPVVGVIAMLFLPDLLVKTLNGTSQGVALPLFLFALYFALRGRRRAFFLIAAAILFTHHLTGLVTLVLYYTAWVLPRSRDPGFLRAEWPYLLFFAAWPLYWAWTFSRTSETYLAPIFLLMAMAFGLPLAGLLYLAAPRVGRALDWAGARVASLPGSAVLVLAIMAGLVAWSLSGLALHTPGLSDQAPANRTVVALYSALLIFGGAAVLARRHLGLTLFVATLLGLGLVDLAAGCQHVFDALRVVDYAILGGLAALFSPGLRPRWAGRPLLLTIAAIAVVAGAVRLESGYGRLFAHTTNELEAAQWIKSNTPRNATIATDTKMSLLILGEGGRNATYEGTWWLFDGSPVRPFVATLNGARRFRERPIRYVALSDYMTERGAEIAWFSATLKPDRRLPQRIDDLGQRVYDRGGVTIWELDPVEPLLQDEVRLSVPSRLLYRLDAGVAGGVCR